MARSAATDGFRPRVLSPVMAHDARFRRYRRGADSRIDGVKEE